MSCPVLQEGHPTGMPKLIHTHVRSAGQDETLSIHRSRVKNGAAICRGPVVTCKNYSTQYLQMAT